MSIGWSSLTKCQVPACSYRDFLLKHSFLNLHNLLASGTQSLDPFYFTNGNPYKKSQLCSDQCISGYKICMEMQVDKNTLISVISKLISCFKLWNSKFHYSIMLTILHVHNYTCFVYISTRWTIHINYYLNHFNIAQVNHRAQLHHAFTSVLKNPDFNNHVILRKQNGIWPYILSSLEEIRIIMHLVCMHNNLEYYTDQQKQFNCISISFKIFL